MKTVQIMLDEDLLKTIDHEVKDLHTKRSAFTSDALRQALKSMHLRKLEECHRLGYMKKPASGGEFDVWEAEQKWGVT